MSGSSKHRLDVDSGDETEKDENEKKAEAQVDLFASSQRNKFRHITEAEEEAKHNINTLDAVFATVPENEEEEEEEEEEKKEILIQKSVSKNVENKEDQQKILNPSIDLPDTLSKDKTLAARKMEAKRLRQIILAKLKIAKLNHEKMLYLLQMEYIRRNTKNVTVELKIMTDTDFLELYHEKLGTHEGLRNIPPDMKLLLITLVTEHQRAILFHWYTYQMFGSFSFPQEDEEGQPKEEKTLLQITEGEYKITNLGKKFKKFSMRFLRTVSPSAKDERQIKTTLLPNKPFQDMTDDEITEFVKKYMDGFLERIEQNKQGSGSSSVEIDNSEDQRRFIIYSSQHNQALFWDMEETEGRDAMRFYLLCEYPVFFFQADTKLRRLVFLEGELNGDDENDFSNNSKSQKSGRSKKFQQSKYQKALELSLTTLEEQISDLTIDENKKTNLAEEIRNLKKKLIKPQSQSANGGRKLTPEEYRQRAVINTREWRKKHPEKFYDSTLLWNEVKKEKYLNDPVYKFKVKRNKYLTNVQQGYIASPNVEKLIQFGIKYDKDIGNYILEYPNAVLEQVTIVEYNKNATRYLEGIDIPEWVKDLPKSNKNRLRNSQNIEQTPKLQNPERQPVEQQNVKKRSSGVP